MRNDKLHFADPQPTDKELEAINSQLEEASAKNWTEEDVRTLSNELYHNVTYVAEDMEEGDNIMELAEDMAMGLYDRKLHKTLVKRGYHWDDRNHRYDKSATYRRMDCFDRTLSSALTKTDWKRLIEGQAKHYYDRGVKVEINTQLPYVAVDGAGIEFFSQGEDASQLLDEAEKASEKFNVSEEDWILYYLDSAGALETVK